MSRITSRWWKRLQASFAAISSPPGERDRCVFGAHPLGAGQRGIAVAGGVLCDRCFAVAQAALRPAESPARCTCCRRHLAPGMPRSIGVSVTICPGCLALAGEIFASDPARDADAEQR